MALPVVIAITALSVVIVITALSVKLSSLSQYCQLPYDVTVLKLFGGILGNNGNCKKIKDRQTNNTHTNRRTVSKMITANEM